MTTSLVRVEVPGRWAGAGGTRDFPGRALQGWFYGELAKCDEALAGMVHGIEGEKPFHVAIRRDVDGDTLVVCGYGPLASVAEGLALRVPGRVLFDARWWERTGEARVERTGWADIAARMLRYPVRRRVRMAFTTPTTFRSGGHYLPLPVPATLFGSLLQRWRVWSPVSLEAECEAALRDIVVRWHRVHSAAVQLKGLIPAFLGTVEFEIRQSPGPYTGILDLLAEFCRFSGAGAKVSSGFGCVSVVPGEEPCSPAAGPAADA